MKILHDAQMGGSIYILGLDKTVPKVPPAKFSVFMRAFVCMDREQSPVLFIDAIECGYDFFRDLKHWRGYDEHMEKIVNPSRIHLPYFALAAAMYMAEKLEIGRVIPRDFELGQLARTIGVPERRVFGKDQGHWKIGLHSRKKNSGVYTHSLYRGKTNGTGHQVRLPVMQRYPYKGESDLAMQLEFRAWEIKEQNRGRRKLFPRTERRLRALESLYDVFSNNHLTTEATKDRVKSVIADCYKSIGRSSPITT